MDEPVVNIFSGPSTEYVISLRAYNSIGEGQTVYEAVYTRDEIEEDPLFPIAPPLGVKAIIISASSILVMWTDSTLGSNQQITGNSLTIYLLQCAILSWYLWSQQT